MKFWIGVFLTLLVVSPRQEILYETIVREVEVAPKLKDTPILDGLIDDWDEVDRQSDCLYKYLLDHVGYGITLEHVLTAGWWTDSIGGACLVIGEDDE